MSTALSDPSDFERFGGEVAPEDFNPAPGAAYRAEHLAMERDALRPLLLGDWDAWERMRDWNPDWFAPQHAAIFEAICGHFFYLAQTGREREEISPQALFDALLMAGLLRGPVLDYYEYRYPEWTEAGERGETFTFETIPLSYVVGIATGAEATQR